MSKTQKQKLKPTERRCFSGAEMRVDEDAGTITGYAALFNSETDLGWEREMIAPGAFGRSMRNGADVRALFNHDPNIVLGRNTAGTLDLTEDDRGLAYIIHLPDTEQARAIREGIKRGDISQSSFAFRPVRDERITNENGKDLRILHEVELFDVSPVTYPSYKDTVASARATEVHNAAGEVRTVGDLIDAWAEDDNGGNADDHSVDAEGNTQDRDSEPTPATTPEENPDSYPDADHLRKRARARDRT